MSTTTRDNNSRYLLIISSLFLGTFLTALGTSTINLALTDLMKFFNTSLDAVKWAMTGFMLSTGIVAPITSYLGEKFSYKKLFLIAIIGYTVTSALCALSWSISSLVIFRIIQGAFNGMAMPATMSIIYQTIPSRRQSLAIGLWSMAAMLAPAVGPTLSGWLIQNFSWKGIFLINIPIGLIASVIVWKFTPYYKLNAPEGFDFFGFTTSLAAGLLLLTAFSEGASWGWNSKEIIILLLLGFITLGLFIKRELSTSSPALNLRIFKNRGYTMSIIVRAVITLSLYAGSLLTPLFLQNAQQLSPLDAGLVMLIPSLGMALSMIVVSKLYDLINPRILVVIGILAVGFGSFQMSHLNIETSRSYIIIWMLVRNMGISFTMMPVTNLGMSSLDKELAGYGSSVNNWVAQSIGSLALGVFTSLLSLRTTQHVKDLMSGNITGSIDANVLQMKGFVMGVNDLYFISCIIILMALPFVLFMKNGNLPKKSK